MKLLAMERIKLFSTRSPYWCLASILVGGLGFGLLISLVPFDGHQLASTGTSQAGMQLGMTIFLVLAALAITTEYRFGTIRTTFLTAPSRFSVLAAKTLIVVALGIAIALITSFAAFFAIKLFARDPQWMQLETAAQWRFVVGNAAIYAIAGVLAVAIGTLIRQSAGAISLLLVWAMLAENLIALIPWIREHSINLWLPFNAGGAFVSDPAMLAEMGRGAPGGMDMIGADGPGPWEGLAVFGGTALALWLLAAFVLNRRDA